MLIECDLLDRPVFNAGGGSTNALATIEYVNQSTNGLVKANITNGLVTASFTNGLATILYVNTAANGLGGTSVTNGLATIDYVNASTIWTKETLP